MLLKTTNYIMNKAKLYIRVAQLYIRVAQLYIIF
jgi:hypothetical protein